MIFDYNILAVLTIVVGVVALFFFVIDKFPMETVSIGLLSALAIIQVIFANEQNNGISNLLAGFANPGLITVMALLIMAEGMVATGAISSIARLFEIENKINTIILFSIILICVAVLSSVMNNTPIVVMFIPLIAALVEKNNIDVSKTLLPLSYVSMLGGMTTLMGSSTNLIGAGIVTGFNIKPIGLLDMSIPALIIALPSLIFTLLVIPRLLPKQQTFKNPFARDARQFLAEIEVKENSKLLQLKIENNNINELDNSNILFIQRGEHAFYPPIQNLVLKVGDVIVLAATRKSLEEGISKLDDQLQPQLTRDLSGDLVEIDKNLVKESRVLAEVLVAPSSEMIGKDLEQIRFRNFTGCIVLGLLRRSRMLKDRVTEIPLLAGDVLLVQGTESAISSLKNNSDVVLIDWTRKYLPQKKKLFRSTIIFLTTILTAASGLIDLATASIIGASAMVLTNALSINRAANAINKRIYITIASMLAYGTALETSGGAQLIVKNLMFLLNDKPVSFVLCSMFILVTIFTNFLTNNATVIIFMPIAINLSYAFNVDPMAFIITIILASNISFCTPFGYQTNLLVMAPGHYRFRDYVRCGIPLTILTWLIYIFFLPQYFGY